jgi:hypothetical protein
MTDAVVAAVEALGVEAVQPAHAVREVGLRCLEQQVEVVVEQDPGVQHPGETPARRLEGSRPPGAVDVVEHDRPTLDSA